MTKITIIPEKPGAPDSKFRATARERESFGKTPGAALDALTKQLSDEEAGTLIVIVNQRDTSHAAPSLADLFADWKAEDGTDDPAEISRRNQEVEELKQAMNRNRLEMEGWSSPRSWISRS
jgi:hypothetical protein